MPEIPTRLETLARLIEVSQENKRLREANAQLEEENGRLKRELWDLQQRFAALEARVNQNSGNSSKPPSSDPPSLKLGPKKKPSGRKPGGQPGHKGSHRELIPVEKVNKVEDHYPIHCGRCEALFRGGVRTEVGEPLRHQVAEIPEVAAYVTEHRLHSLLCDRCDHTTQADLPGGVPAGAFGPRLQAVIALFTGCYHVSKRTAMSALGDLFGTVLSLGSVSASEQVVSEAVAAPVTEAHEYVQKQPVVHADETGWTERRKRAWLWIAGTPLVAVFLIHAHRGADAARALLGNFAGILVTDRWSAYSGWSLKLRQLCWAHLLRDFNFIAESKGTAGAVGQALVSLTHKLFRDWHRVRDGTMTRAAFQKRAARIRIRVELLIKQGAGCYAPKVAGMCRKILDVESALWTFVCVEGVEPTNNFGYAARGITEAMPRPGICRVWAGWCCERVGSLILDGLGVGIVRGSGGT
ncbi:MAG: IS66 family transposase [Myxococcales bacterium]